MNDINQLMKEVRKISKNQQWFLKIAKDAPIKIKEKTTDKELDENKIDKEYFSMILDYITEEASMTAATPLEKQQLFEEFNSGKNQTFIVKEEYEKFQERIGLMLAASQNDG